MLEPKCGHGGGASVFFHPGNAGVLSAFVMYVRPLAHKYNIPVNFLEEIGVALESGSRAV
jgi:hypothetical protein